MGALKLSHEIESYNPVTGAIRAWVLLPSLSHTADTIFYLSYGNAAIATNQEDRAPSTPPAPPPTPPIGRPPPPTIKPRPPPSTPSWARIPTPSRPPDLSSPARRP